MFMSVDLPAPFSPIRPWMDPRATESETTRFACTGPKRLSIARSSSAGPEGPRGAWGAGLCASTALRRLVFGNADLARDDVGPGLVQAPLHFRGYQLAIEFVQRIADPVLRQAEHPGAGLPGPVPRVVEDRLDRDVDALHRRGEDAAGVQVILVAVAPDAKEPGVGRRLHDADPGRARRVEHHVRAAPELAFRQLGAKRGICPCRGRCAGHVLDDLGLRGHGAHARAVAERKLA